MGNKRYLEKEDKKERLQVYIKQKYAKIIEDKAKELNETKSKVASDIIENHFQNREE